MGKRRYKTFFTAEIASGETVYLKVTGTVAHIDIKHVSGSPTVVVSDIMPDEEELELYNEAVADDVIFKDEPFPRVFDGVGIDDGNVKITSTGGVVKVYMRAIL